jgi:hypothetical protein
MLFEQYLIFTRWLLDVALTDKLFPTHPKRACAYGGNDISTSSLELVKSKPGRTDQE